MPDEVFHFPVRAEALESTGEGFIAQPTNTAKQTKQKSQ